MAVQSLLPPSATALERRVEAAMSRLADIDVPVGQVWNAATCPAALLPWLAWALSVDTWRTDWSEAQKRAVIAAAPRAHRIKGTVAGVKAAITAVAQGQPFRVVEWFDAEGTGQPYTGFAEVDVTDAPPAQAAAIAHDLFAAVAASRPARAHVPVRLKARTSAGVRLAAVMRRPQAYAHIDGANIVRPRLQAGLRAAALLSRPLAVCVLRGDGVVLPVFQSAVRAAAALRRPVGSAVIRGSAA